MTFIEWDIMTTMETTPKDTDEYIAGFPKDVQEILEKLRMTIKNATPDAEETISYQIPTFTLLTALDPFLRSVDPG